MPEANKRRQGRKDGFAAGKEVLTERRDAYPRNAVKRVQAMEGERLCRRQKSAPGMPLSACVLEWARSLSAGYLIRVIRQHFVGIALLSFRATHVYNVAGIHT